MPSIGQNLQPSKVMVTSPYEWKTKASKQASKQASMQARLGLNRSSNTLSMAILIDLLMLQFSLYAAPVMTLRTGQFPLLYMYKHKSNQWHWVCMVCFYGQSNYQFVQMKPLLLKTLNQFIFQNSFDLVEHIRKFHVYQYVEVRGVVISLYPKRCYVQITLY